MAEFTPFAFDSTAFMSGQIGSKLWLCETLEPIIQERINRPAVIWLLGGWYGMTNFLLQTRGRAMISRVVSYDIDPEACRGALIFNENFDFLNNFRVEVADVNKLSYADRPDVVINTSTEHMESSEWFDRIPDDTLCVFQSNDMPHDDHVHHCDHAVDLVDQFPMRETIYLGDKTFVYPEWSFTRFMHIGTK